MLTAKDLADTLAASTASTIADAVAATRKAMREHQQTCERCGALPDLLGAVALDGAVLLVCADEARGHFVLPAEVAVTLSYELQGSALSSGMSRAHMLQTIMAAMASRGST